MVEEIVKWFKIEGKPESIEPLGDGFINDTFIVRTTGDSPDYILQRKNKNIFTDIPGMMDNTHRVTEYMRNYVADPQREAMTIIPTLGGKYYLEDEDGDYWTMSMYIPDTITYDKADTPALAKMGGKGIGRFQALLAHFDEPLAETLPGFHNIKYRFEQWDEALAADKTGRVKDLTDEIAWIESRRQQMLGFWTLVEDGFLPKRVTHNDTKISNILFDKSGDVLCAIDLDTVMSAIALNDFGDAIRSYANTGDEDDKDLSRVGMSLAMFAAFAEGYLSEMGRILTTIEKDWLAFSARYITYEQVLRFLMDYINGNTYYKIKYPEHNLVRTHAQQALLEDMERKYAEMCKIIKDLTVMQVPRIKTPEEITKLKANDIACANWRDFPTGPHTTFKIASTDDAIVIEFDVDEATPRAVNTADHDPVWQDSCVEFFCQMPGDNRYYNFEFNSNGACLASRRKSRKEDVEPLSVEQMAMIKRQVNKTDGQWTLTVQIPFSLISYDPTRGDTIRANFYKCGDLCDEPHYLTWAPIALPKPDYHCPQFFGTIKL